MCVEDEHVCVHVYVLRTYMCALSTQVCVPVVFERLTEKHLPELYKLLKDRLQILSMISLSWFLTLFFSVLDHKVALNIIDCVFLDGPKVWEPALLYHIFDGPKVWEPALLYHIFDGPKVWEYALLCHVLGGPKVC